MSMAVADLPVTSGPKFPSVPTHLETELFRFPQECLASLAAGLRAESDRVISLDWHDIGQGGGYTLLGLAQNWEI